MNGTTVRALKQALRGTTVRTVYAGGTTRDGTYLHFRVSKRQALEALRPLRPNQLLPIIDCGDMVKIL
jgi:hypothetical protein